MHSLSGSLIASMVSIALLLLNYVPTIMASDATADNCEARLLVLLPCMPFVQGLVAVPADICCNNLVDMYGHHPRCLCSLIDQSSTSFSINRTLALRLPPLCGVSNIDASQCSEGPTSQTVETRNSTDNPAPVAARSGSVVFGMPSGGGSQLEGPTSLVLLMAFLVTKLLFK